MTGPGLAYQTYEALAPTYDVVTEGIDSEQRTATVANLAREHGVPGGRLLDAACGTGRNFESMAEHGYDVSACDVSPAMVRCARRRLARAGGHGRIEVADMRDLPRWGRFDLVTCMMDPINYLLGIDELDDAFASVARTLRLGGLYIFDVTSLSNYRLLSANPSILDAYDVSFSWHGRISTEMRANGLCRWRERLLIGDHDVATHFQRHWPVDLVRQRLERAGLRCVDVLGLTKGVFTHAVPDESRHPKVLFIARRDSNEPRRRNGGTMRWTN